MRLSTAGVMRRCFGGACLSLPTAPARPSLSLWVQAENFSFSLPSLGRLQALTLASDGSGRSAGWHCELVCVQDVETGETTFFTCDRWAGWPSSSAPPSFRPAGMGSSSFLHPLDSQHLAGIQQALMPRLESCQVLVWCMQVAGQRPWAVSAAGGLAPRPPPGPPALPALPAHLGNPARWDGRCVGEGQCPAELAEPGALLYREHRVSRALAASSGGVLRARYGMLQCFSTAFCCLVHMPAGDVYVELVGAAGSSGWRRVSPQVGGPSRLCRLQRSAALLPPSGLPPVLCLCMAMALCNSFR